MDLKPVRGTRDFPLKICGCERGSSVIFAPLLNCLPSKSTTLPILESEELYTRKAGEEITGQLYNFRDKGTVR